MFPRSRTSFLLLAVITTFLLSSCSTENPVSRGGYAVLKVNRNLLDNLGYETFAVGDLKKEADYQYMLRHSPLKQKGVRFHIKWKAPRRSGAIRLVLDVQGLNAANLTTRDTVTQNYPDMDGWAEWSTIDITGKQFKQIGEIMAWRVTICSGDRVMAELPSANWYSDIHSEPKAK